MYTYRSCIYICHWPDKHSESSSGADAEAPQQAVVFPQQEYRPIPFSIKRKVLDACFVSSILYAGETWLTSDLKALESMYTTAIKALLGVRKSTCTDLCLIESGYPTLKALVMKRRIDFLKKTIPHLDREDPLRRALDLCEKANTNGYKYLMKVINTGV